MPASDMDRNRDALSRRLRDSNCVSALVVIISAVALAPLVLDFTARRPELSEFVLSLSWLLSTAVLTAYAGVHVLDAVGDTRRFLEDYGTEYASGAAVFCHALGQRLFSLVAVGFALVFLAITGAGVGVPLAVLVALGLAGATLLGPPTAIPMNRRVSERLAEYRGE